MHTLQLSDNELVILQEAIDMLHDMKDDTVLDEMWIGEKIVSIPRGQVMNMRRAVEVKITELQAISILRDRIERLD